jgi:hypothetical protein
MMNVTEKSQPVLSIVVPVHQMAGKLGRLQSWIEIAVKQGIELVIVHDRGDLFTGGELRKIIESVNSKKIQFLEGEYRGPGNARNAGKSIATGKFLNFTDSDDLPEPLELLKMCNQLIETQKSICIGGYKICDSREQQKSVLIKSSRYWLLNKIKMIYQPGIWRFVFSRDILQDSQFGKEKMGEDQYLVSQLNLSKKNVNFSRSICYTYFTGHSSQLTRDVNKYQSLQKSLLEMAKLLRGKTNQIGIFLFLRMEMSLIVSLKSRPHLEEILAINKIIRIRKYQYLFFIFYFVSGFILHRFSRFISNVRNSDY